MRRVKHVFIARLVTGIVTIAMVIAMIIPLVIFFATRAKDKGIEYISLIFVVPFALSLFGFFLTLALRTKKYECGGKTYYAHNGFFIVELYEENKLLNVCLLSLLHLISIIQTKTVIKYSWNFVHFWEYR